MKTITCKRCGEVFDLALGECPVCGAVYYIVPSDDNAPKAPDMDETRVWGTPMQPPQGRDDAVFHQVYGGEQAPIRRTPPDSVYDSNYRDGYSNRRDDNNSYRDDYDDIPPRKKPQRGRLDRRTVGFIVGGLFLLAILTVILSFMGGVFKFGDKSASEYMPDVIGKNQLSATVVLEALGLTVNTVSAADEAAEGTVIAQSIREGRKLTNISSVTLTVSSGPDSQSQVSTNPTSGLSTPSIPSTPPPTPTPTPTPSPSPTPVTHDISVIAGKGGSVSPSGLVRVSDGGSTTFTFTPDDGYEISDIKIDGQSIGVQTSYTFQNVTGTHTVYAIFRVIPATPSPTPAPTQTPSPAPTPTPTQTPTQTQTPEPSPTPSE